MTDTHTAPACGLDGSERESIDMVAFAESACGMTRLQEASAPSGNGAMEVHDAGCDGVRIAEALSQGRSYLLRAAANDAMVRHYELEALAEAADPRHESDEKRAEQVAFCRGLADEYRKHAETYRRLARSVGESIPDPTMSGMLRAVRSTQAVQP